MEFHCDLNQALQEAFGHANRNGDALRTWPPLSLQAAAHKQQCVCTEGLTDRLPSWRSHPAVMQRATFILCLIQRWLSQQSPLFVCLFVCRGLCVGLLLTMSTRSGVWLRDKVWVQTHDCVWRERLTVITGCQFPSSSSPACLERRSVPLRSILILVSARLAPCPVLLN